ncbi:MAG: hypothetical protein LBS91_07020 [Clostridiales Family XIII bacterium]|jgi:hypothetical protein|nr:hypothetical protein [Clostridiales Family XIII bacterium]
MARVFRPKKTAGTIKAVGFIAVVVVLVFLVYAGLGNFSGTQDQKQIEIAQEAIVKAAVQCYALESQFPSGLQYLVDNYGLVLDEEKYVYHYRAIGSNMVPEVKVFPNTAHGGGN